MMNSTEYAPQRGDVIWIGLTQFVKLWDNMSDDNLNGDPL